MKKYKTNSFFTWICEHNGKKFVRKYKRNGLHAYPRTLSLKCISKCLNTSGILYPKLLRNSIKYTDEEYIENRIALSGIYIDETERRIYGNLYIDANGMIGAAFLPYIDADKKTYASIGKNKELIKIIKDVIYKNR